MEVFNQALDGFTQSVSFKYDWESMNHKYSKELSKIQSTAKISGFRKGKVPLKIIGQRYGKSILADLQSDAVQESWRHLVNDLQIVPLSQPALDMPSPLHRGKQLEFTFSFEVIPPFELPEVSILEGEKVSWTVSEDRLAQDIKSLCDQHGEWNDLKRRKKSRDGDLVTISLKGFDGENEVEGLTSEEEKVELGQQRIIPEIEEAIVGLKAEETFSLEYTFPTDHPNESLLGKTILFEGAVTNIQEKKMLTLEELIEKVPDETEEALKERIAKELKEQKDQESLHTLRESVALQLKSKTDFELPPLAVEEQVHARLHHRHDHGADEACEHNHSESEKEEAESAAKSDLRFEAIVREYARANEITVSEFDFTGRLLEMLRSAGEYGMQMIQFYQQPANRDRLKATILDDMVIDSYIEAADFTAVEREIGLEE